MDTNMYVEFYSDKYTRTPYVENVIECSEEHIHFNGEYNIKNEELPMRIFMSIYFIENKPYEDEASRRNYRSNSQIIKRNLYEIEIQAHIKMSLLPSTEHVIYFRVINRFETLKEFLQTIQTIQKIHNVNEHLPNLHRRGGE